MVTDDTDWTARSDFFAGLDFWTGLPRGCDASCLPTRCSREVIQHLKVRNDSNLVAVATDLTGIQLAVHEWYPTWPVARRLAGLATKTGVDLEATLLTPVAVAAETGLPSATTSEEIAELARPHFAAVVLL